MTVDLDARVNPLERSRNKLRGLSLCTGYGGIEKAIEDSFAKRGKQVQTVAFAEFDEKVADLYRSIEPGIPNIGDLSLVDWQELKDGFIHGWARWPIDIISAGYPCQPFSQAGARRGINDDRHIWPHIFEAVRVLRPRYVFLENVAGHRTRGFGDVLGDLAQAGYDARWTSLRASDVGAPHRRERVVILATPSPNADGERFPRWPQRDSSPA